MKLFLTLALLVIISSNIVSINYIANPTVIKMIYKIIFP